MLSAIILFEILGLPGITIILCKDRLLFATKQRWPWVAKLPAPLLLSSMPKTHIFPSANRKAKPFAIPAIIPLSASCPEDGALMHARVNLCLQIHCDRVNQHGRYPSTEGLIILAVSTILLKIHSHISSACLPVLTFHTLSPSVASQPMPIFLEATSLILLQTIRIIWVLITIIGLLFVWGFCFCWGFSCIPHALFFWLFIV